MIFTIIAYILFALSFKKEYGVSLSYYSIIIVIIRQPIRLLDFENTRPSLSGINWNFMLLMQCVTNVAIISLTVIMFGNFKYNNMFMAICAWFTIGCASIGSIEIPGIKENSIIIYYVPAYFFMIFNVFLVGRHVPNMVKLILQKAKMISKFK